MNLFSYVPNDEGGEVFKVSSHIWAFVLLAAVFSLATLISMFGSNAWQLWREWRGSYSQAKKERDRRRSVSESFSIWGGTSPGILLPEQASTRQA